MERPAASCVNRHRTPALSVGWRYLEFARDADEPAIRARMMKLARNLGWLSSAELRAELVQMMRDRLLQNVVGPGDVELFCLLNRSGELDDRTGEVLEALRGTVREKLEIANPNWF